MSFAVSTRFTSPQPWNLEPPVVRGLKLHSVRLMSARMTPPRLKIWPLLNLEKTNQSKNRLRTRKDQIQRGHDYSVRRAENPLTAAADREPDRSAQRSSLAHSDDQRRYFLLVFLVSLSAFFFDFAACFLVLAACFFSALASFLAAVVV